MLLNWISKTFQTHCQDQHSFKIFGTVGMLASEVKKLGSFKWKLTLKPNNARLNLGTHFEVWLLPNQNIKKLEKSVQAARPPAHHGFVK